MQTWNLECPLTSAPVLAERQVEAARHRRRAHGPGKTLGAQTGALAECFQHRLVGRGLELADSNEQRGGSTRDA